MQRWTSFGPGDEDKNYGTLSTNSTVKGNFTTGKLLQFAQSGHPVLRCTSLSSKEH